jgi:hypothetical protein
VTQSLVDIFVPRSVKVTSILVLLKPYFQCSQWGCLFQLVFEMSIREKAKVSNKLRKEEKLHLKEERQAFDANKEFPLWKVVDYDLQTEEFF